MALTECINYARKLSVDEYCTQTRFNFFRVRLSNTYFQIYNMFICDLCIISLKL